VGPSCRRLREREREREAGARGPAWAESGELGHCSKKKRRVGRWAGPEWGKGKDFVLFFSFFQIHFKPIFQPFLNQIFYIFSNLNFNTNFSNYFRGFSQTIFNNFSNIF
jgi:hypothetical protein